MTKIRDLIAYSVEVLSKISDTARLDTELMLCRVLGIDRVKLMMNYGEAIEKKDLEVFEEMLSKRKKGMPIAYILNNKEFMGYDFYVDENVLIPRSDTEVLVEETLKIIEKNNMKKINAIDMCSGSGAISISIYLETIDRFDLVDNDINFVGLDISKRAVDVAIKNKLNLKADGVEFMVSDLFSTQEISEFKNNTDIIVSNPPYIRPEVIETLSADVKDFEPKIALDGGEDGLIFYRNISDKAREYLKEGGYLIFEVGHDQSEDVINIMVDNGFVDIYTKKDIQNYERVVVGRLKNATLE